MVPANISTLHRTRSLQAPSSCNVHAHQKYISTRSVTLSQRLADGPSTSGCRFQGSTLGHARRPKRGGLLVSNVFSNSAGYPFNEQDYLRVVLLERAPYGPMKILPANDQNANTYSGVLVFQRDGERPLHTETPIMEIFVAGDTACNIYTQLHGHKSSRPMVHDLMYNLLARAVDLDGRQWQLLRVAIVALENDIFVGRLFFGDAATGTVMWDCDCRPSDGVYLSLRTSCPFYVSRKVWDQAAVPIRLSKVHMIAVHEAHLAAVQQQQQIQQQAAQQQQQQQDHNGASSGTSGSGMTTTGARGGPEQSSLQEQGHDGFGPSSSFDFTSIKPDDPEPIKLLKREMEVAVLEEDYAAAIRLRDHPYMQLYRRIEAFLHVGRAEEAAMLQRELASMIQNNNSSVRNR